MEERLEPELREAAALVKGALSSQHHTPLTPLNPSQILLVRSGAIKCGQLRLLARLVPSDGPLLLVSFEETLEGLDQQRYYITGEQWQRAKAGPDGYRILRLRDYLALSADAVTRNHLIIEMEDVMDVDPPPPPPQPPCAPHLLWLHKEVAHSPLLYLDCESAHQRVLFYCSLLLDSVLWRVLLPHRQEVAAKWFAYIRRHCPTPDLSSAGYHLVAAYIRARPGVCEDEFLHHWVRTECLLFRGVSPQVDREAFHHNLLGHVSFFAGLESLTLRWQHAQWHHFTVQEGVYWVAEQGGCLTVSALWLLEEEMAQCATLSNVREGRATLTEDAFDAHFLPCLYRHTLLDLTHYLATGPVECYGEAWSARGVLLSRVEESVALPLTKLSFHKGAMDTVLDFSVTHLNYHSSPVIKRTLAHFQQCEERAALYGDQPRRVTNRLADFVDIEDLFARPTDYLPPCLSRVVPAKWYKCFDRLNLVSYLVDSGYRNVTKVVQLMCRQENTAPHRRDIATIHIEKTRKKYGELEGRRVSVPCATIINSVYQEGHLLRCPYEEAQNGAVRRRDHTKGEQAGFRKECACALAGNPVIYSPLDFISHRLAQSGLNKKS
jgi:hypothetical protein